MVRPRIVKIVVVGLVATMFSAMATTSRRAVTFASFLSTTSNKWEFTNSGSSSVLRTTVTNRIFFSSLASGVLDYDGLCDATLNATVTGPAVVDSFGNISQEVSGTLAFINSSLGSAHDNLLTVNFTAIIAGSPAGTTAVGFYNLPNAFVSYSSEHLLPGASFAGPHDFSLAFSTIPGMTINANHYLNSFTITPSGQFQAGDASVAPAPEPASLSLMAMAIPILIWRPRGRIGPARFS